MEHGAEPQRKKPVDWDELYPGRFLKAGQILATKQKKIMLTITDVSTEKLRTDQGEKVKGIVSFQETDVGLALNKTNGICLKAMFGRKLSEWVGKRIVLFPDKFNGDDCIRVWGSPDISADMVVQIELPRRKPYPMTMHAPKDAKGGAAPKDDDGEMSEEQERDAFGDKP